jgi:ankyrin repeat protein
MIVKSIMTSGLTVLLLAASKMAWAQEAPLSDAAEKADWKHVRKLLDEDVDLSAPQVDGMTALHWATWHDHTQTALELIERGANVAAKNRYGVAALSIACTNGNAALVERLLKAGADANTALAGGETALMTAARTGRIGVAKALLEHGADVNAKERNGQTAIMWAAAEGHADVVSLLIESGADYQTPLVSGFTPLLFAVREGKTEVVRVLLAAGADVNATMRPEVKGDRMPRRGTSPLVLAVENGHFELAIRLLEAGADPNDQRSGFTPLHAISWVRKPNRGDGVDGDPPPIGSGNVTSLPFVRKLVEHGADVNARLERGRSGRGQLNHRGATPLLLAADTADVPLMRLLLELGADATIANADHCPPLLAAAGIGTLAPGEEAGTEEEALEAVRLLLELGADINAVDDNGETAMHGAAYMSLPKMVQLLADHGADIKVWNTTNKYGWTPLLIAEGYRPGNFKPAAETIAALHRVMRAAGVEPPTGPTPRAARNDDEYSSRKEKKKPPQPESQ